MDETTRGGLIPSRVTVIAVISIIEAILNLGCWLSTRLSYGDRYCSLGSSYTLAKKGDSDERMRRTWFKKKLRSTNVVGKNQVFCALL